MQNLKQFNEFKRQIEQSGRDPVEMLNEEIKKRGLSKEQLNQLAEMAKSLNNIMRRN